MRDSYGYWYVYFIYGMHFCANITTNKGGVGAVLIRAVEPTAGVTHMKRRRKTDSMQNLCSGPAKFCQAFGVGKKENNTPIGGDFVIYDASAVSKRDIGISPRIGITQGTDLPWRFFIKDRSVPTFVKELLQI
jgi:DNA-3-methyladenine glycosylase